VLSVKVTAWLVPSTKRLAEVSGPSGVIPCSKMVSAAMKDSSVVVFDYNCIADTEPKRASNVILVFIFLSNK
jgi:hypothetical protein